MCSLGDLECRPRLETATHSLPASPKELFHYPGEKQAKVIGRAAAEPPVEGARVRGLLVAKTFNYLVLTPDELERAFG